MKIGEAIETLQYFFLDIVGVIIPGLSFIIGIGYILNLTNVPLPFIPDNFEEVLLIAFGYVLGHMVTSIGNNLFIPLFAYVASALRKVPIIKKIVPSSFKTTEELTSTIVKSDPFIQFSELLEQSSYQLMSSKKIGEGNLHNSRNIAMTIAQDEKNVVYKFMFVSLLNSGMGTVLLLLPIIWLALFVINSFVVSKILLAPINWWAIAVMFLMAPPFFERSAHFYGISMRVPFPIASAKLISEMKENEHIEASKRNDEPSYQSNKKRIYLAGGFKSGWQEVVIKENPHLTFYNPREHNIVNEDAYTLWDLEAIKSCDWIFVYLEKGNPAGYALALEIGFAKALGKRIILIDEKSVEKAEARKYLGMLHASSDVVLNTFEDGLLYLKKLEPICS